MVALIDDSKVNTMYMYMVDINRSRVSHGSRSLCGNDKLLSRGLSKFMAAIRYTYQWVGQSSKLFIFKNMNYSCPIAMINFVLYRECLFDHFRTSSYTHIECGKTDTLLNLDCKVSGQFLLTL